MEVVQSTTRSLSSRLRSFSKELFSLDQKPLVDPTFSFPWDDYAQALSKVFGCNLVLARGTLEWKSTADLLEGIPKPHIPLFIDLPGLSGPLQLVISKTDLETLMSHTLNVTPLLLQQQDPSFFDQFVLFTSTELIACAQSLSALQSLSPRLSSPVDMTTAGCLCLDIHITLEKTESLSRLLIPPSFLEGWKTLRAYTPNPYTDSLTSCCSIEAGRTFLTAEEISSLQPGDFLFIDHPFFIPNSSKSRLFLTLHGNPLFRAKLKDEKVQILEMPLEHEAFIPIGGHTMPAKVTLTPQDEEEHEIGEDETVPPAEPDPFETEETKDEDPSPITEKEVRSITSVSSRLVKEPLRLDNLPLSVVVQLAEVTMTIAQISALQPGNLLDLQIQPENGVCLVVNNQIFATGDLVVIGDNVGVHIKEIGLNPTKAT